MPQSSNSVHEDYSEFNFAFDFDKFLDHCARDHHSDSESEDDLNKTQDYDDVIELELPSMSPEIKELKLTIFYPTTVSLPEHPTCYKQVIMNSEEHK